MNVKILSKYRMPLAGAVIVSVMAIGGLVHGLELRDILLAVGLWVTVIVFSSWGFEVRRNGC